MPPAPSIRFFSSEVSIISESVLHSSESLISDSSKDLFLRGRPLGLLVFGGDAGLGGGAGLGSTT